MNTARIAALIFLGLAGIVAASCNPDYSTGVPGGQAAARSVGREEALEPRPIEIQVDGKFRKNLEWKELKELPEERFGTGREDVQTGYPLVDVLAHLDVRQGAAVTLYGAGLKPVVLKWDEIVDRENKVLLGLTHKGTAKVVAGNSRVLNRDGWVRHLQKIDISQSVQPPADGGRISESNKNPLHPRKQSGQGP